MRSQIQLLSEVKYNVCGDLCIDNFSPPSVRQVGRASLLVGRLYQSNAVIIRGGLVLTVLQMPSRRLSSLLLE